MKKIITTENEKISEDVIVTNILPKLPAKSVLRFKSVRKSWYAQIRGPSFVDKYLKSSHARPDGSALLFSTHNPRLRQQIFFSARVNDDGDDETDAKVEPPVKWLRKLDAGSELNVSPSVNGIFCIHPPAIQIGFNRNNNSRSGVFIFNPTTREILTLPPLGLNKEMAVYYHFGLDTLNREYKVVGMCCSFFDAEFTEGAPVECQIFTLGGGDSWRKVSPVSPVSFLPSSPGICVNGAIHWLVKEKRILLAFDLGDEVFRVIQLHSDIYNDENVEDENDDDYDDEDEWNDVEEESKWPCLIQVGGFLAIMKYDYDIVAREDIISMYVLKDYQKEQWVMESMNCPEYCNLCIAVPHGSTRIDEFFIALNHGPGSGLPKILSCDMSRETNRRIELPEAAELLGRKYSEFMTIDLIGCYPENLMPLPKND